MFTRIPSIARSNTTRSQCQSLHKTLATLFNSNILVLFFLLFITTSLVSTTTTSSTTTPPPLSSSKSNEHQTSSARSFRFSVHSHSESAIDYAISPGYVSLLLGGASVIIAGLMI